MLKITHYHFKEFQKEFVSKNELAIWIVDHTGVAYNSAIGRINKALAGKNKLYGFVIYKK